jgi:serine-type D-Ala-D-Ala carboxypeptidase (penicillin-binding protein 5/6)
LTRSPFLDTSARRRQSVARLRARRRRARAGVIGALTLCTLAAVLLIDHGLGAGAPVRSSSRTAQTSQSSTQASPGSAAAPSAPGAAAGDPVSLQIKHPPRGGLLVDLDSGRVLWRRNPDGVLPIASLAKMMTALLVVQSAPPDAQVRITRQALAYQGSGMGVLPRGKAVPLESLLVGLLLPSGNDAAIALAQHVAGTTAAFVARMNDTAARLGLHCTHYASVDGFDDANVSCASDLVTLARIDLQQPRLARIVRLPSAVVPLPIKGGKAYLYNNNYLVRLGYPGITGLKTGETNAAGLCIVATADRAGRRLAVVLLHSPNPAALHLQARQLLDAGFAVER